MVPGKFSESSEFSIEERNHSVKVTVLSRLSDLLGIHKIDLIRKRAEVSGVRQAKKGNSIEMISENKQAQEHNIFRTKTPGEDVQKVPKEKLPNACRDLR
ncbi:hypothetical protein RUM44_012803 [Polyplax serrata]|uniref:Uncharacterized protein n=1 Tax=Polyplax serrata TaxID=468196 RepID=A0ABR1BCC1_POLSC